MKHPEPTEANRLEEILGGDDNLWRGRYRVLWCHQCDTAVIVCPDCQNSSCSGGGCEKCRADSEAFALLKRRPRDFLTASELSAYKKGLEIQQVILDAIRGG